MSFRARVPAIVALALWLAGCDASPPPAAAAPAPAPKSSISHQAATLDALLKATYGAHARVDATWTGRVDDNERQQRLCAQRIPLAVGGNEGLLAVCSDDPQGTGPGTVELLAIRISNSGWRVEARKAAIESGANGAVTEAPDIVQIGPTLWAVATHGSFMSQGWVIAGTDLWAVRASKFEQVATYNTFYDNSGTCGDDDCAGQGINLESSSTFDKATPGPAWTLVVPRKGNACDTPYERRFRYEFDASAFRYHTPEGPPEIECAGGGG
jgi:hypothetical protein